jgi:hypothetical protein
MIDIRTIFDEVSKDQPPSAITRAAAVSAGRRARHRRNLIGTAGVAAAVAAIAIGSVMLPVQFSAAPPEAQPGRPGPTGQSPSVESPEDVAARLTAVVKAAAARARPDARFLADPYYRSGVHPGALDIVPPRLHDRTSAAAASDLNWYEGYAIVVDAQGKGTISVHVAASGLEMGMGTRPCVAYSVTRSACAPRTGPHGEHLSVLTSTKDDGFLENTVTVYFADGSAVSVDATNFTGEPHSNQPYRATPSFTIDQLVQIATSPGMTLHP